MTVDVQCGGCGKTLRVSEQHAGKMARCPVCSHITAVPPATGLADPPAAAGSGSLTSPSTGWFLSTPEGQAYGPASREELQRWVQEGRITADCQLSESENGPWHPAAEILPELAPVNVAPAGGVGIQPANPFPHSLAPEYSGGPAVPDPRSAYAPVDTRIHPGSYTPGPATSFAGAAHGYVVPHRGAMILILALVSLFITCPAFCLMAWVMGSNDLREMQAGRMDRSGMDVTRVGMIIGMVLSILWILGFLFFFCIFLLAAASG